MNGAGRLVGIIMGSQSDWDTMQHAASTLDRLGIGYEARIVSAHRTPDRLYEYARTAKSRGLRLIIAGAGGAAHLPGMAAALTPLPVLGVPIESKTLKGVDSLLSIVQMPAGVPVGTLAIGKAGAVNAALLAVAMLANSRPALREKLRQFRAEQTARVRNEGKTGEERINRAYQLLYGRLPTADERKAANDYLKTVSEKLLALGTPAGGDLPVKAWESLARALFLSNEFVYLD